MKTLEYLSAPASVKDVDVKQGIVTGYGSSFGTLDSYGDRVMPGAFANTIKWWGPEGKRRIKLLYQHDPTELLGAPHVLREDSFGLYHETKVSQTARGQDVLRLIEDGVITEHSIGFTTVSSHDAKDGTRELTELKLYEVSFVTWGANEDTPVMGMKSLEPVQIMSHMERVEKALRTGLWESEDLPHMLELSVKQWRTYLESLSEPAGSGDTPEGGAAAEANPLAELALDLKHRAAVAELMAISHQIKGNKWTSRS